MDRCLPRERHGPIRPGHESTKVAGFERRVPRPPVPIGEQPLDGEGLRVLDKLLGERRIVDTHDATPPLAADGTRKVRLDSHRTGARDPPAFDRDEARLRVVGQATAPRHVDDREAIVRIRPEPACVIQQRVRGGVEQSLML